jgi:hypothetical protein
MVFSYPGFLWGLFALAIPVIIHLFNFQRYKKVYFTNVKFLRRLEEETRSRSRLREWLVLACRCLFLAALVLAFAQPFIPGEDWRSRSGARAVSIYIDNSFSMENVNRQGQLLDIARTRAKEVIQAMGPSAKFQLITNDFEGRHQRLYGSDDALRIADEVRVSPTVRLLSEVTARQSEFLRSTGSANRRIYCFSDAQRSTFDIEKLKSDSTTTINLVPLAANKVNNLYVDSCWFASPLQQKGFIQKLHARIRNKGESAIDAGSAKLYLNDKQQAISSFSVKEGGSTEIAFTFECREEGFNYGSIRIEDFPVTFDDELFFAFSSRVSIGVSVLNGRDVPSENPLSALFTGDSIFQTRVMSEQVIDYGHIRQSDLVVLNQLSEISSGLLSELQKFSNKGGSVVIIPPANLASVTYTTALTALKLPMLAAADTTEQRMSPIPPSQPFFSGVFEKVSERINLPRVKRRYLLQRNARSDWEPLLQLQNGDALLGVTRLNNASVYLSAVPFDDVSSNLPRHALIVPVLYQVSFRSLVAPPLQYETGTNAMIPVKNPAAGSEEPPHIVGRNGGPDLIPALRNGTGGSFLLTQGQVQKPGFYDVLRADEPVMPLAFNYSRLESDLMPYTAQKAEQLVASGGMRHVKILKDADSTLSARTLLAGEGTKLWKLFIFLALLFLLAEATVLKLLK